MSGLIMMFYFVLQSSLVFDYVNYTESIGYLGYACFLGFVPFFLIVVNEFLKKSKQEKLNNEYMRKLNDVLISQTHNELFYQGNLSDGALELTKEVTETIGADRCSIWLYKDSKKDTLICEQLYVKAEKNWYQGIELSKSDFSDYFEYLINDPVIIADDAEKHPATACFTEGYLRPLGIKSMLDIPIIFRGQVIGVVCIESLHLRKWLKCEVDFSNVLSSLYAFAFSVKESNEITLEINKKNTYLEHAAKILRHDMHSGINTYIPRGISSLERRLTPESIKELRIDSPLKMIKEGLKHTQKVYKGVYEFTNLVKKDSTLNKEVCDLKFILEDYLSNTSYSSQVIISDLIECEVNQALFCTALDNLIRNGLKYNDSDYKVVKIFMEDDNNISIQDNGRGMTQEEFEHLSQPYTRKEGQQEQGSGLGLNICVSILKEHGFSVTCEKNDIGTKMNIKLKK
jgi:K+-sensing histidine kinase KdpD